MSGAKTTDLFRFMRKDQLDATAKVAKLADCSFEAATALQLCRRMLNDYCPPAERTKVVAVLVMLEGKRGSQP